MVILQSPVFVNVNNVNGDINEDVGKIEMEYAFIGVAVAILAGVIFGGLIIYCCQKIKLSHIYSQQTLPLIKQ